MLFGVRWLLSKILGWFLAGCYSEEVISPLRARAVLYKTVSNMCRVTPRVK